MLCIALKVLVDVEHINLLTGYIYMPATVFIPSLSDSQENELFGRRPSGKQLFGWHAIILDHMKLSKCHTNPS